MVLGLLVLVNGGDGNDVLEVQRHRLDTVSSQRRLPLADAMSSLSWAGLDAAPTVLPDLPEPAEVEAGEPGLVPADKAGSPRAPENVGIEAIRNTICDAAYSWDCPTALRIVACESGFNSGNSNRIGAGHYGLFQISAIHAYLWPDFWETWDDPVRNTEMAWVIYKRAGSFSPWVCW